MKDRNGLDLTEAEDIKKRWQKYMENCTKKIFTTQIINAEIKLIIFSAAKDGEVVYSQ